MKSFSYLLLPCAVLLLTACGVSSRVLSSSDYAPLPEGTDVIVLKVYEQAPNTATLVGQIKIGDTGFTTNCSYPVVIAKAKELALSIGGNLIKITEHKVPKLEGSCHRVWADVYLLPYEDIVYFSDPEPEIDQALFDENCAVLYFYRSKIYQGSAINYNVKIDDEVVWRAKNNDKEWLKVIAVGPVRITAKTESERELYLNIQPGRRYYIKCGIELGVMVGRPSIELVDEITGKYEFGQIKD